jgi:carboxylesterase type B
VNDAAQVTDALLDALGAPHGRDGLAALLAATPEQLLAAQKTVSAEMGKGLGLPFAPVVDGVVLPAPPAAAVRDGLSATVPVLTGTNRDEWNLFGLLAGSVDDDEALRRRVARLLPGADVDALVATYRAALPGEPINDVFGAIMTDRVFRIPALRLAESQSVHQPDNTFVYFFEHASTAFDGRLGSCHALEIPFVFDTLGRAGVELLTGPQPPQPLADAMHAAWIAFAHTGSPTHAGLPDWPAYDATDRATMTFGGLHEGVAHLELDPAADRRRAWDGLL